MNEPRQGSPLFPPTRRQAWIFLSTTAVLLLAGLLPISRTFLLLITPWSLGMAIMVFDRPGPVRNWLGSVMHTAFYPLALITFNVYMLENGMRSDWPLNWTIVGAINVLLLTSFAFSLRYLWPHHCPCCEQRTLVPLMPWLFREPRSNSTHWCSSCGSQYWRKDGSWRSEQRKTWWDYAR